MHTRLPERVDWQDDTPRSSRFDDIYRARSNALTQSRSVFLAGCGLPERWHGRDQFTVLETGFGLGLNFLTTWATWLADPQACRTLNFVSVEAYPVSSEDILRSTQALATADGASGDLAAQAPLLAQQLAHFWPNLKSGLNQWPFAQGRIQLTLYVGDVLAMLQQWPGQADAVYLDGFSPAVNPDMWSSATLGAVAQHCHSGTRLATYTVAAQVRRSFTKLGFSVEKCPGVPPKRDRLQVHVDNEFFKTD
jgi:tRNA 5-methylaminomethyl-2-thiouridine biosynthesis bifunctional protein